MKTTRLSKKGKIVIFLCISVLILGGAFFAKDLPMFKEVTEGKLNFNTKAEKPVNSTEENNNVASNDRPVINVSLDEWIGWKSVLDANGGLTTQKGSIYDKLGINVKISIINDATQSSNALINGSLDGAGYTINRYAFLYPKFMEAEVPVKMPYITNYSSGGDGIIAKAGINRIEDLVDKKIGVPRFSEAQTLVEWLLTKSSLDAKQVEKIRKNMVYFETPDEAAKAFFAGQVDAAATWQPYLSQAQETTGAKLLFSTKVATNLILDGIVFRQDYLDNNKEDVQKFIQGALEAYDMYTTEFTPIKESMPLFATETDENIVAMSMDATLADFNENKKLLKGTAQSLFEDMSNIWLALDENAMPNDSLDAFDATIIQPLGEKFTVVKNEDVKFTQEQRETAEKQSNNDALLTQRLTINFETGSASIKPDSYKSLNEFAKTASLLNGAIIQVEGNTDSVGDDKGNEKLSFDRAKSVVTYLQYQDLESTRFVIKGNGEKNPVASNDTEEGKSQNRRTDIFFKVVD